MAHPALLASPLRRGIIERAGLDENMPPPMPMLPAAQQPLNELMPPNAQDDFTALAAAATPFKELSKNKPLTPWGYPRSSLEPKSAASSTASSNASWQTIRAGLLSPPPLSSSLLLSPPPAERVDEFEDEEMEEAPTANGPGGWLVNLVEGFDLWSAPPAQAVA